MQLPPAREALPPPPADPIEITGDEWSACELEVTDSHVYWLAIRDRARARATIGTGSGAHGVGLRCDEAGGVLRRVSRTTHVKETVAELDYRPFGLARRGDHLYWTGAHCDAEYAKATDPEWLWTWNTNGASPPSPIGDRDRKYLGIVVNPTTSFVSDRFGRGGAYAFGNGEEVLPKSESAWLIAANPTTLYWSDRAHALWETDLATKRSTQRLALGAMPMEGHLFPAGLLVRTTSEIIVLSTAPTGIRYRFPIPDYGDRGNGAFIDNRYYTWADGTAHLTRLDVVTGERKQVDLPTAKQACGVAITENGTLYWGDRGTHSIQAWRTSIFDLPP